MRRAVILCLGLFELALAVVLLGIGLLLPGPAAVRDSFDRAQRVTENARQQVALVRNDLDAVRGPGVERVVRDIEPRLARTLGSLANGMEAWAKALDPALVEQLHDSVNRLASFLESVAPAAGRSAQRLEVITVALRKDAVILSQLLKEAPPDLKAAREVYDSLGRFSEGLDQATLLMDPTRLKAMREGFKGMEGALATGARQVAKLATYTYPVVTIKNFRPLVNEKPFWPEGERIAEGMRKGAKALKAAGKELDAQATNLPKLQKSLEESRRAVARTRAALGKALKDQKKLEAVLLTVPRNSIRLAEELPAMTGELVKVLREAERLKDVAAALRGKQHNIESATRSWPGLRLRLLDSAARLRDLKRKLERLLDDPATLDARLARLDKQRDGLTALGQNLDGVQQALPALGETTATLTLLLRCLFWLLASLMALHACVQLTRIRRHRPVPVA